MRQKRPILLLALGLLLAVPCSGQITSGTVSGRVVERVSNRPIGGAEIRIFDRRQTVAGTATTDERGEYRLELPPGSYTGQVGGPGLATQSIGQSVGQPIGLITVTSGYNSIYNIRLDVRLEEVVDVRGGYDTPPLDQPLSTISLRRAEIRSLPGTGGDVLRTISSLPGVTSLSGQFGDLLVRGGLPGENLTFIDNIPVGDFTYLNDQYDNGRGGRAAVLAADVFERLEFSAGGFGPRYGDRLSSALDITIRQASRDRIQGTVFADLGVAGMSVEVPLPGRGPRSRGGWFSSIRRSYIDLAFEVFDLGEIGQPRNLDLVNKLNFDLNARHQLTVTALAFSERYTLPLRIARGAANRQERLVTERAGDRYILGMTLSSTLRNRIYSNLTLWGTGEQNNGSSLRIDNVTLQRQRDLRESQFGVKEELTASVWPRLTLATGGGLVVQQGDLFTFERSPVGFSLIREEYLAPTRRHRLQLGLTSTAYGYGSLSWQATRRLTITPGARIDRYGLTGESLFSPRLSARLGLARRLALNLGWGVYRQPPSTFILALAAENRNLRAQRATHLIAGLEWLWRDETRLTIEAYEKRYDRVIVRPTLSSPVHFNSGETVVQGVELTLWKALSGWLAGQAAYAWTRGRRSLTPDGQRFPLEVARPHQLTLIGLTRLGRWSLATKFRVASGLPYSPLVPVSSGTSPAVTLYDLARPADRAAASLPHFRQLDLRIERRFNFNRWSFAPYLDIFNLTRRRNVTEVTWRPAGIGFLGEQTRIPIIGTRIEF